MLTNPCCALSTYIKVRLWPAWTASPTHIQACTHIPLAHLPITPQAGILDKDPFQTIDEEGVGALIALSASEGKKSPVHAIQKVRAPARLDAPPSSHIQPPQCG